MQREPGNGQEKGKLKRALLYALHPWRRDRLGVCTEGNAAGKEADTSTMVDNGAPPRRC